MDLSPAKRKLQQSYIVQTFLVPMLWVGLGAALISILASANGNLANLDVSHLKLGLGVGGFAAIAYASAIMQHGLGSTQFASDGTTNQLAVASKRLVDAAVTVQAKAADPSDQSTQPQDATEVKRLVGAVATQVAIAANTAEVKAEAK